MTSKKSLEERLDKTEYRKLDLDDKLRLANGGEVIEGEVVGGYDPSKYSVGRYLLLTSIPDLFDLKLTQKNLNEIGDRVKKLTKSNMENCIYPAINTLLTSLYGTTIPWIKEMEGAEKIDNELGFLKKLANRSYSGLRLSDKAKKALIKIKKAKSGHSTPFNMYFIDKKVLDKQNSNGKELPIQYLMAREKTLPTIVLKYHERERRVLDISDEDLKKIDKKNKGIKKEDVTKYILNYVKNAIKSGESFYDYHYANSKDHGDLGGPLNELIGDLFLIDDAGVKICANKEEIKRIKGVMGGRLGKLLRYLPSRTENFFDKNIKDKSIVYAIRGMFESNYGEIRLQTVKDNYEGEVGDNAHGLTYKNKIIRKVRAAEKKIPIIAKSISTHCKMLGIHDKNLIYH